jgi:hypothetical protein
MCLCPIRSRAFVQLVLAIAVMVGLWLLAAVLGVPDGWDAFTGIVLGGVLLGLWEAFARQP